MATPAETQEAIQELQTRRWSVRWYGMDSIVVEAQDKPKHIGERASVTDLALSILAIRDDYDATQATAQRRREARDLSELLRRDEYLSPRKVTQQDPDTGQDVEVTVWDVLDINGTVLVSGSQGYLAAAEERGEQRRGR